MDARAAVRRRARGRAVGPHRRAAPDDHGTRNAGHGSRLAGCGHTARRRVRVAHRRVRDDRLRHGAVLHAGRQRRAVLGRARRGRQGVGGRTRRSARSAASSVSRSWQPCSRTPAATSRAAKAYTDGLRPAVDVGAFVAVDAVAAMLIPRRERPSSDPVPVLAGVTDGDAVGSSGSEEPEGRSARRRRSGHPGGMPEAGLELPIRGS